MFEPTKGHRPRKKANMATATDYKTEYEMLQEAHLAGLYAGNTANPTPYQIVNQNQEVVDFLDDGLCGFAWITIRPARGKLVAYLKQRDWGSKGWNGGWEIWVREYGQSYERKYAYAKAFAWTLQQYGIDATAGARLD